MSEGKRGLGVGADLLGFEELLANVEVPIAVSSDVAESGQDGLVQYVPYNKLRPGSVQPRCTMNDERLVELARSIREHGIIQPIIVQPMTGAHYPIIAGERRWRAAKLANLHQVPVIIKNFSPKQAVAVALIENIQREDLNAVDQARGLLRLTEEFGLTHQEVAKLLGKSRVAVTNLLRVLKLSDAILNYVVAGQLDVGHVRCLLALPAGKQRGVAEDMIKHQLSVRAAEQWVKTLLSKAEKVSIEPTLEKSVVKVRQSQWQTWCRTLNKSLAMPVKIRPGRGKRVNIEFCCDDDEKLKKLIDILQAEV